MDSWHSYPSIYALGHRAIKNLLTVPIVVEEKIDGSQFSFGITDAGDLLVRSKGQQMEVGSEEKMFHLAVETAKELSPQLQCGWTYRAEYLQKPKHNTLAYDRVPEKHLVIFDINRGHEDYLSYEEKRSEAESLGLECVPNLFEGMLSDISVLTSLLDRTSILGGQKIEGVVVKQQSPSLFGLDKKALIGKYVSEAFKEIHSSDWKDRNPSGKDIIQIIGDSLKTPARWDKAIIHLQEKGILEGSPRDIGLLFKEVPADVLKECEDDIKDQLFRHAWPNIQRIITGGLAEYYKERLMKQQFEGVAQ